MKLDLYEITPDDDAYETATHDVLHSASFRAYRGTETCSVCGLSLTGTVGYSTDDLSIQVHERCTTVHLIPSN